jgi:spore germination protein
MVKRTFAVVMLACVCFSLAGCWDRVEIDQRGFVVGVGIDLVPEPEDEEQSQKKSNTYRGTYQIVKPSGLSSTNGGTGGGQPQDAHLNISTEEDSLPSITSRISSMVGRSPYFEHLQMIILSSQLARKPGAVTDVLDYFLRDVEMRRDIKIIVAHGGAKDVLNVASLNEKYPVAYLVSVSENVKNTSYMLPATRIGDMHEYMLKKDGYTVQTVRSKGRDASFDGAAVFEGKSNLLLGFLNGPETQGLNLLQSQAKGGILKTAYDGSTIDIELEVAQRSIRADIRSPRDISFTIAISVEGMLDASVSDMAVDQEDVILDMQKKLEAQIQATCRKTIDKLQKKYREDVIGLGQWLRRNHYGIWNQIKDDWNESIFPNVEIDVVPYVEIRRNGNIIKSEVGY